MPIVVRICVKPSADTRVIQVSTVDNLGYIRKILEPSVQQTFFDKHKNVPPLELQIFGTTLLFCSLGQNSDLLYGSLKYLNTLHKLHPDICFHYNKQLLQHLTFNSNADKYMDDFLMTLYSCAESSFNGVRQEALDLFTYWIKDKIVAMDVFAKICFSWPWTNRNKYYFLTILFEWHDFYYLLQRGEIPPTYFVRGAVISLQYRNLISPGQTLIVQLAKDKVNEVYEVIADVLRNAKDFELQNCVQWLHCIPHLERLYELLDLADENILVNEKFSYLLDENMTKLVIFRRAFKTCFQQHTKIMEIDRLIVSNYDIVDLAHRAAIFEVLISNTMTHLGNIEKNLHHLQNFLRDNMYHEFAALRQDIMKLLPGLFYLLTSILKSCSNELKDEIKTFFQFLKLQIFDKGIVLEPYPPVIFSLRLYEILMKLLYGRREDRLIKEFNVDKNNRLKSFLIDENVWNPCSVEHCSALTGLMKSEFDDVRDIATELLVRFFPTGSIENMYQELMTSSDITLCRHAHLFARIAIKNDEPKLEESLKEFLNRNVFDYDDPFFKIMTGNHLFGAINCVNEFYSFHKKAIGLKDTKSVLPKNALFDITLADKITDRSLLLLRTACFDEIDKCSPSFEKMDESLELLLLRSSYPVVDIFEDKKSLLLSIWLTVKACCELAANISHSILDNCRRLSESDHPSLMDIVTKSVNITSNVLLRCRHKGAIEAAGLSLGKIVRSITRNCNADSKMFEIVTSSVDKIFDVIGKTDTTRRGAGFSIMVLHLVKNDISKDKMIVKHVVDVLLDKLTAKTTLQKELQNRDNLQASILHFLCVLFKDGDLKSSLSSYLVKVFSITIYMIESCEWTIRNAALQLFGAIIPKLVGQSQYFVNPEISWQPVNTAYNDIITKMNGIHNNVLHILDSNQLPDNSSILLVSVLELLSRVEVIGQSDDTLEVRKYFFKMLSFDSEKIRNLAAKSLARFHEFFEIQQTIDYLLPQFFLTCNENCKHGIVIGILYLLHKYQSDIRYTGRASNAEDLFNHTKTLLLKHFREQSNSFYVRCYLLNLLQFIEFDRFDVIVLNMIFECENLTCRQDVERELVKLDTAHKYNEFGFDLWKQNIQNIYLNCELKEELEI
ncbi:Thyroid adenoma-associated protein like, partial [Pseudolycoriella hygida]